MQLSYIRLSAEDIQEVIILASAKVLVKCVCAYCELEIQNRLYLAGKGKAYMINETLVTRFTITFLIISWSLRLKPFVFETANHGCEIKELNRFHLQQHP